MPRRFCRVCSQLSQPNDNGSEMNERQEGLSEFVVSCSDTSELLDTCKKALDQIAAAVDMSIKWARVDAV